MAYQKIIEFNDPYYSNGEHIYVFNLRYVQDIRITLTSVDSNSLAGYELVNSSGVIFHQNHEIGSSIYDNLAAGTWYLHVQGGVGYLEVDSTPPTTPSQFYNPVSAVTLKADEVIALSWATASDSDGNLSGYYLYKSLNGGTFSYLATATTNQYTTTIPTGGYSTVQYRVVAYDATGASSGNCDSSIITINNNSQPTVVVRDNSNNIINNNQIISLTNENDFIFNFTPNDINTTDTLQYNISLGAVVLVPYTPCTKNVVVSYTVLFADLVRGNNVITLNIKDSNNAITTVTFTLKNKVTDALSFRTVLQILQSLSYTNTSCTCLNDLKPSGYSKTVLSMSDIISSI